MAILNRSTVGRFSAKTMFKLHLHEITGDIRNEINQVSAANNKNAFKSIVLEKFGHCIASWPGFLGVW